jgi:hypothetical protein
VVAALALALVVFEGSSPSPSVGAARIDGWTLGADLRIDGEIRDLQLQFFDGEQLWATRGEEVWRGDPSGRSWQMAGRLGPSAEGAVAALRDRLGATRTARMLHPRRGVESLLVLESGALLASLPPWIQRSDDGGQSWERVHRFRADPPRGVLRHWDQDGGGDVWFGEYGAGGDAADSRVWRSRDDGLSWEVAWTFGPRGTPGGARHVHAVQVDPVGGRPWVATGDRGDDVRLGWLDLGGRFEQVAGSAPSGKAVSLLFTDEHVLWGADAPDGPCGVWRWSRTDGSLQQVAELPGPVLYSTALADGTLIVATEVEGVGLDGGLHVSRDGGATWVDVARMPSFERPEQRSWGTASFPLGEPMPSLLFNVERLGVIERSVIVAGLDP